MPTGFVLHGLHGKDVFNHLLDIPAVFRQYKLWSAGVIIVFHIHNFDKAKGKISADQNNGIIFPVLFVAPAVDPSIVTRYYSQLGKFQQQLFFLAKFLKKHGGFAVRSEMPSIWTILPIPKEDVPPASPTG